MGTRTRAAKAPWTVDLGHVRAAALGVVSDADALDFTCAAIELGAAGPEAVLIGELLSLRQKCATGFLS